MKNFTDRFYELKEECIDSTITRRTSGTKKTSNHKPEKVVIKRKVSNEMFAFLDSTTKKFRHVYETKKLVELCTPFGFETKGKIVKVIIKEV